MSRTSKAAHLAAVMVRWANDATRIAEKTIGPLLDLFIRLWLAGIFWASGMVKLQNWTIALYLSAHEYPVSWLDPLAAAWLGEAIEIVCPPAAGVRPCDAVRRSADADPVPVLLSGLGSTLVLGDSVRMVCHQGCRADLTRRTDRAQDRGHRPPLGGEDHPCLRGPLAPGRSLHQASAALLDRRPVLPVGCHEDQQL